MRSSSGPQGLNNMAKKWVQLNGGQGRLRPFVMYDASEAERIKPTNDIIVGEETYRWIISKNDFEKSNDTIFEDQLGFIPNQIVDPTGCLAKIGDCRYSHCHDRKDIRESGALFVHHCHESWGGESVAARQQQEELKFKKLLQKTPPKI